MDLTRLPNGKWKLRWYEGGRRRSRQFDRKGDAELFDAHRRRRHQLGQAAVPDDMPLRDFVEIYWRLHAIPNLAPATRDLYARIWANHILPRLGDYSVRQLTPKRLARFREELERANVGTATVVKAMTIVQSILTFAVGEAGAVNAGLFAVALLAVTDPALSLKLTEFRKTQEAAVQAMRLPPAK